MAKLDPTWEETAESLFQRSIETGNRRLRERFLALALIASGRSLLQVAEQIGRRRQTVADWVQRYNASGVQGLQPGFKSTAQTILTDAEFETLRAALKQAPQDVGLSGTVWRGWLVAEYIEKTFGKSVHPETARRYFNRLKNQRRKTR